MDEGPLPRWEEACCVVCPAQVLGPGRFDVIDRPGPHAPYHPEQGYRINTETGAPTCVHPYRVGMPVGAYASAGDVIPPLDAEPPTPAPAALELPADVVDLEGWLVAVLRMAGPDTMAAALVKAETIASAYFTPDQVVSALRRVLSHELTRG